MEVVIFVALGAIVLAVLIDAVRTRPPPEPHDPTITTTQKIIVDLTKRH